MADQPTPATVLSTARNYVQAVRYAVEWLDRDRGFMPGPADYFRQAEATLVASVQLVDVLAGLEDVITGLRAILAELESRKGDHITLRRQTGKLWFDLRPDDTKDE